MHQDVRKLLVENHHDASRDLEKIYDLLAKNQQAITVLPITVNDRIEKIIDKLDANMDKRVDGVLNDVRISLNDLRGKVYGYLSTKDKEEGEAKKQEALVHLHREEDITGKIEIFKDGTINTKIQTRWLTKAAPVAWRVAKWTGASIAGIGGVHAIIEFIQRYFMHH